jgi:glycosyltransferase involved in cell wall biosynthesis
MTQQLRRSGVTRVPEPSRPAGQQKILMTVINFPPAIGGTAFLLYDLLRFFPADSLVVVSGALYDNKKSDQTLPFVSERVLALGSEWLTPRVALRFPHAYINMIVRHICRLAVAHKVKRIYAHYPSSHFMIAAYLAAEKLGLPLAVYFDILWEENGGPGVNLARAYERRIVQRADLRYAITEYAMDHLCKKHGVPFQLMPHTILPGPLAQSSEPIANHVRRIHFAGGINPQMNQDALLRLAGIVARLDGNVVLDLYSPSTYQQLHQSGFPSAGVSVQYRPRSELPRIQQASDVLFLPQSFDTMSSEMIRCNFPTKALEYMIAGRPILVHSPSGSYLSEMAKKHAFGLVVDTPDEDALERALMEILHNEELRRQLVNKAAEFVRTRDSVLWSRKLYDGLFGNVS